MRETREVAFKSVSTQSISSAICIFARARSFSSLCAIVDKLNILVQGDAVAPMADLSDSVEFPDGHDRLGLLI